MKKFKVLGPHGLIWNRKTIKPESVIEIASDDKRLQSLLDRKLIAPFVAEEKPERKPKEKSNSKPEGESEAQG